MKPALRMIASNPVLGVGPGVYGYVLGRYSYGWTGWIYIVHNDYLLVWAERGVIGFLAFLLWVRAALRVTRRASSPVARPFGAIGVRGLRGPRRAPVGDLLDADDVFPVLRRPLVAPRNAGHLAGLRRRA